MNSFICWIGGKKNLREKILKEFPEKGTYARYVEVFGGAGWVLFSSERHAKIEVYNDINGNLVNLFRCVKYHPEEVQKELELALISREQFWDAKKQLDMRGLTDIQRAARFFIIIKESFGSDLYSFGSKVKDLNRARDYLMVVSERLRTVIIENQDFQRIIQNNDRVDTLFYFDPPYCNAEKYYADRRVKNDQLFGKEDHTRLKEALDSINGKFILSYNDCDSIRKLYKDYNIVKVDRTHNFLLSKGGGKYAELIIKNF